MATKRQTGDPTTKEQSSTAANNNGIKKESAKRPPRKLKNLDNNSDSLRWVMFVLVFSLAVLGIIYYYNYYQPKGTISASSNKSNQSAANKRSTTSTNESTERNSKASTKTKPKQTKDTRKEDIQSSASTKNSRTKKSSKKPEASPVNKETKKDKSKPETHPKQDTPLQYPKERFDHLAVFPKNLRDRLLRLPIPPSDADRPLALEIVSADDYLADKEYSKALEKFNEIIKRLPQSPRGLYGKAIALEHISEKRNNLKVLDNAIEYYRKVSMDSFLAPEIIKEACLIRLVTLLNRRENYDKAISACEKLCDMDPDNDGYAIQLGLTYLRAGEVPLAKEQLTKVLEKWPDSAIAKANMGYIHYTEGDCQSAVPLLMAGLEGDKGIKKNPRFYVYAGECLVKLNMYNESLELYQVAVDLKLFSSLWQRSLINEKGLRAQPWWNVKDTGMESELKELIKRKDTLISELFPLVSEGRFLSPSGSNHTVWTLYYNSARDEDNCHVTPQSCDLLGNITQLVNREVKVILFPASLHIRPHVGLHNTKLKAIAPLQLTGSLVIRVADEKRDIEEDMVYVIDDSFEQELWHQSDGTSLILIVELWHPDTQQLKQTENNNH